ncbi:MAG: dihydroneopterin aldolase [Pseudomonadota bacterium]
MKSTIDLSDLALTLSLGTYGPDDVVPDVHLLDLRLTIDPARVFIEADGMTHVFDYDPLIREIDRLAQDGHYDTQEWLMTRIVRACADHPEIEAVDISLRKQPVLRESGALGVSLQVSREDMQALRGAR